MEYQLDAHRRRDGGWKGTVEKKIPLSDLTYDARAHIYYSTRRLTFPGEKQSDFFPPFLCSTAQINITPCSNRELNSYKNLRKPFQ